MIKKIEFLQGDSCLLFTDLVWVNYFVGESLVDIDLALQQVIKLKPEEHLQKKFSFGLEEDLEKELKYFQKQHLKPVLILEYPENSLFPKQQKEIPAYLTKISKHFDIQIFVATTSPFILGGMMKLTETRKQILEIPKKDFRPSQKVYFLNQGSTSTKSGRKGFTKMGKCLGSDGYWGYKAGKLAMKILGTGLDDFLSNVEPEYSAGSPVLVFCEGAGRSNDAKMYNKIFEGYKIPILFVSSKSNSETLWSYELLTQVKNGLSGDFQIFMLRDRDHDFPHLKNIENMQLKHPTRRVLFRRAIECYIYNSETAGLLFEKYQMTLPKSLKRELDDINAEIQIEVESRVLGNSYKFRLQDGFKKVYQFLKDHYQKPEEIVSFANLKFQIAELINPDTEVYKELEQVLFGK